jgi:hypothetical protein
LLNAFCTAGGISPDGSPAVGAPGVSPESNTTLYPLSFGGWSDRAFACANATGAGAAVAVAGELADAIVSSAEAALASSWALAFIATDNTQAANAAARMFTII